VNSFTVSAFCAWYFFCRFRTLSLAVSYAGVTLFCGAWDSPELVPQAQQGREILKECEPPVLSFLPSDLFIGG
jgi:hypothetical protein